MPLDVVTPRPLTRSTRPDGVPAATLSLTGSPPSVGTSMVAPSAASVKVIGTVTRKFSPSRVNTGCGFTATCTTMSPLSPPSGEGRPRPRSRIFCPSLTPAGIFTLSGRPSSPCSVTVSPCTAVANDSVVRAVTSAPFCGPPKPR